LSSLRSLSRLQLAGALRPVSVLYSAFRVE
jgi:hypothetical protein